MRIRIRMSMRIRMRISMRMTIRMPVCVSSLRLSPFESLLIEYQENLFDNINIRNVITKGFSYLILSYKIINFQFYFRINVLDCTIT